MTPNTSGEMEMGLHLLLMCGLTIGHVVQADVTLVLAALSWLMFLSRWVDRPGHPRCAPLTLTSLRLAVDDFNMWDISCERRAAEAGSTHNAKSEPLAPRLSAAQIGANPS